MKDLFGGDVGEFKTAKQRYGVWPVTVWDCDMSDPQVQRFKRMVGDMTDSRTESGNLGYQSKSVDRQKGSGCGKDFTRTGGGKKKIKFTREECFSKRTGSKKSVYAGKITASIFNPAIAYWLLNCYAPKKGICFDPFAGGGTRAIMAARHGLKYVGIEIRKEECIALRERAENAGYRKRIKIIKGDARNCSKVEDEYADFIITCPPYWNLEKYKGGEKDLSMLPTYNAFCKELYKAVKETWRILKPGAVACWIVGLHRDKDDSLLCLNHDVTRMHRKAGFWVKEEIILHIKNTGAIRRVGSFDKGKHKLIRTHEYALVFIKPE